MDCLTLYLQALPSAETSAFILRLKCDGTRAETRFRLSAKRTSPFKSAGGGEGASVQSATGSRDVRISGSNAGYTMFRRSLKGTGYPLHSPVSPSLPLPCVTVCHHIFNWTLPRTRIRRYSSAPLREPQISCRSTHFLQCHVSCCSHRICSCLFRPLQALSAADFCNSVSHHHMYFNSVDPYRITKSIWLYLLHGAESFLRS